jgi:hypothetical protein
LAAKGCQFLPAAGGATVNLFFDPSNMFVDAFAWVFAVASLGTTKPAADTAANLVNCRRVIFIAYLLVLS